MFLTAIGSCLCSDENFYSQENWAFLSFQAWWWPCFPWSARVIIFTRRNMKWSPNQLAVLLPLTNDSNFKELRQMQLVGLSSLFSLTLPDWLRWILWKTAIPTFGFLSFLFRKKSFLEVVLLLLLLFIQAKSDSEFNLITGLTNNMSYFAAGAVVLGWFAVPILLK